MLQKILLTSFLFFLSVFLIFSNASALIMIPCPPGYDFIPPLGCVPIGPEEPDPVIVLRGIAGSRNLDLMLGGVFSDNWSLNGGTYNDLIIALTDAGYEQGTDLFIGFYDWRQDNAQSATDYLIPVIDEALASTGAEKVDIVAHSMGGLVARSYIQSAGYRGDVDQLIMLGTPNEGSSDAYLL